MVAKAKIATIETATMRGKRQEPDIDELARADLLGSNCTIGRAFVIQSVELQGQLVSHIWPAKRNESPAEAVGLSNTPKDFVEDRPRVQQQAN